MSLELNIAPIKFDDADIEVGVLPFNNREQLLDLRKTHGSTHIFKRTFQNELLIVRRDTGTLALACDRKKIRLSENLSLCATLFRESLIDHFVSCKCDVLDFRPVRIVSRNAKEEILNSCLPHGLIHPGWLSVRPLVVADVRVFHLDQQQPFVGLVLDVRTRNRILEDCGRLIERGLEVKGLFVGEQKPSSDQRVAARIMMMGRVSKVEDGFLHLDDAKDGISSLKPDSAWLKVDHEAVFRCMRLAFGAQADRVETALSTALANLRAGPTRAAKMNEILQYLRRQTLYILPDMPVQVQSFLNNDRPSFPKVYNASTPIYVFDPSSQKTESHPAKGLGNHGPYSLQTFTPNRPRICVVCQSARKGQVEQFLRKFFDGITPGTGKYPPFTKGLVRGYGLETISTDFFLSTDASLPAYKKAVDAALESQADKNVKWDLALVQVDEATHELQRSQNPYVIAKAAFLSHQIPVQEFETETMSYQGAQMEYSLSNMALATYAKMGGIPWLIKADPTIAHELILGLGSCYVGDRAFGSRERIVGITTVFSGDGNYFLSNLSKAVPMAEFQNAVLDALRASLTKAQAQMNWQRGDHVRLVFHAFKPMKDIEAEAVKMVTSELTDYSVEFAFLHIAEDHPYVITDNQQRGIQDASGHAKGQYAPLRGQYCLLSNHEVLLTVTGPKEVKKASDGMPFPLLLNLHRASTFRDTSYLAKQVFAFTAHSWRSFLPASAPVTIMYSELIAKMLGNFAAVPHWNPDAMLGKVGRSRWFL